MNIHVCIVSDQILPNLIPVLMERPDKVWLASSREMSARKLDQRLKKQLQRDGVAVEVLSDAPDAGMRAIQEYALGLATAIETAHPSSEITLNATGGNKLMAMGFVEVFRGIAQRVLYTDTFHRCIERLPSADGTVHSPLQMTEVLDVPRYLSVQGFATVRAVSDESGWALSVASRKGAAKYLGREAAHLGPLIGTVNALASQALKRDPGSRNETLVAPRQDLREVPRGTWAKAMEELAKAKVLGWEPGGREIIFIDVPRTQFLRGGWLEEFAWHIVHDEAPHDARMGVTVVIEGAGSGENEFDVLATHGNQLLFIECKTLRFNPDENDNELAYKLDSLGRQARGLFGETWLLSARDPTPALLERARANRFRIIGPAELRNLRDLVRGWMGRTS